LTLNCSNINTLYIYNSMITKLIVFESNLVPVGFNVTVEVGG
jgi:hypothetical protein